ncbi:MAG TPA: DUF2520 domain-containing protein [Puia sp.]|jgi:predicted short-subunit dehydrogenase-like oxidoreductase (DUF2520 family)|nr:DUF2520 domain-containing protein [Puia sp.]
MKVVIIGSGNVATVLGRRFLRAEHEIIEVISKNETHVKTLADELHCDYSNNFVNISDHADLYIIAVSDDALMDLSTQLQFQNKIVVHTAGSVSKNILQNISKNFGVLYPLQTLRKEIKTDFEIPILIDGNTGETLAVIEDFAKTISDNVQIASDDTRLQLHVAATIVNNFSNHLFALTENYCNQQKIDFKLLIPLIEETSKRTEQFSPSQMQTGPAIRHDIQTIQTHLQLLDNFPELKKIYELFTGSIQKQNL